MAKSLVLRTAIVLTVCLLMVRVAAGQSCYTSSIQSPSPFMGNHGEMFRLADGTVWEVTYEYQYLYEYYPKVTICPTRGVLILGDKSLKVQRVGELARPSPPKSARRDELLKLDLRRDDEFSFYDSAGRATAYLEPSGGLVFYLWSGEPVAYLDDESVYGFNGKHLGWYHSGLIYDHQGGLVVAPASAFREPPDAAPAPSLKNLTPLKGLKELKPLKPLFGRAWSELSARVLFLQGVD